MQIKRTPGRPSIAREAFFILGEKADHVDLSALKDNSLSPRENLEAFRKIAAPNMRDLREVL